MGYERVETHYPTTCGNVFLVAPRDGRGVSFPFRRFTCVEWLTLSFMNFVPEYRDFWIIILSSDTCT